MYEYFEKQLKKRKFLMMDETRLQVLKEEGRRAQTQSLSGWYAAEKTDCQRSCSIIIRKQEQENMRSDF